LEIRKNRI